MKPDSRHITFAALVDLAEARLPAAGRAELTAHLAACPRCAEQSSLLARTLEIMRTDTTEDAPSHVLARAVDSFRDPRATNSHKEPSVVQRVLAALRFDSAQLSPAFGLRAGQPAPSRQLLFGAGENELDLRVTPSGEAWIVCGQVLGQCAGGRIELEGGPVFFRAALNALCEFSFPPVKAGRYALRVYLGEAIEIEIPDLEIGS